MNGRSRGMFGSLLAALVCGLLPVPEAHARGGRGGGAHTGGGHARAPHVSAAHRTFKAPTFKAPKMPHAAAPARSSAARGQGRTNNGMANATNTKSRANTTSSRGNKASTNGTGRSSSANNTTTPRSTTSSPYNYTYGSGTNARNYRAHGYGRGYRNRYSGGGYGYGRSQGNNRAVVSRLRSAHSTLARLDRDYQGHRVRAMHSIAMAVRQLSHRSMVSGNTGFANGLNTNMALVRRQGGNNGNAAGRRNGNGNRNQRMPQAQSDAQVSLALRTLQGANMQLTSQGSNTSGHARARGHVQRAMRELNNALRIR